MRLNEIFRGFGNAVSRFLIKKMDANDRQKLLHPVTLRTAQLFFDLFQRYPVITRRQKSEITPFFIIGSGRSGTTLLRSVVMAHSLINIPPESIGRIPNSVKKFYRYGGLAWEDLVNVILGEFSSFDNFPLWEIDLEPTRKILYDLDPSERSLAKIIDQIYQAHISAHKPEAKYWGDKSPFNTLRLKWIDRVFPNARYINLIRDGRDVVSSYLKAGILPSVEVACERWNKSLEYAEEFIEQGNTERIKTVHYESFVKDPEGVTRELCDFLGIEFEEQMFDRREDVELGDDHFKFKQNVKDPITQDSIGKWKQNLTEEQKKVVQEKLESNLQKYRYIE